MGKKTRITFPDGSEIELDPSFKPDQIRAIIEPFTLKNYTQNISDKEVNTQTFPERTFFEIWNTSKKEKLALFIRNCFSEDLWISSKMVLDEQVNQYKTLFFGERPAIGTNLKRLHEADLLIRKSIGSSVVYRQSEKMIQEYPRISNEEFSAIVLESIRE